MMPDSYDWNDRHKKRQPPPASEVIPFPPTNTVNGNSQYGAKALADELYTLANTGEGARNHQLNKAAFNLAQLVAAGHLDPVHTQQQLRTTAIAIGLTVTETDATLRSAFNAGTKHPRQVPELPTKVDVVEVQYDPETGEVINPSQAADTTSRTDDGNALHLINDHHHEYRRIADMRKWFVWDGCRWAQDYEDRAIRETARTQARELPTSTKEERTWQNKSMSAAGISGCVRVAETDPRISIRAAELDAHPEHINTPNGVVNLRTGTIGPHDPGMLLSRITAYPIDLESPHPKWDNFLSQTFRKGNQPDWEMIGYMQRISGLALLGTVTEHILPFLHGSGANGKGVFTLVLQNLLGEADTGGYAVSAPDGFLMSGRDGKHETEIARLRGARLVVCSEQTSGKRFEESKVKRLTGGDLLTGRFMRGDFFDFPPSHLVWVLSNHLPEVREGGPSFWRRVRLIPFLHVVPEVERVPDLHEQLLTAEGPAILGWAAKGAVDVTTNGIRTPDAVVAATREYEISEDSLASFVRDECLLGPNYWAVVGQLRERYEKHCTEIGVEPLSARALAMRLTSEYAVTHGRLSRPQRRTYVGIGLQASEEE